MANRVVRYNPFAEMEALQRQFFGDDQFTATRSVSIPTTDVYTDADGRLIVEAHLPNFGIDDIDISVENDTLTVQASRREQQEDSERRYVVRESSTSFYRSIRLPDRADTGGIQASFDNGVLKVTVPMQPQAEPQKIQVTTGSGRPAGQLSSSSAEGGTAPADASATEEGRTST